MKYPQPNIYVAQMVAIKSNNDIFLIIIKHWYENFSNRQRWFYWEPYR